MHQNYTKSSLFTASQALTEHYTQNLYAPYSSLASRFGGLASPNHDNTLFIIHGQNNLIAAVLVDRVLSNDTFTNLTDHCWMMQVLAALVSAQATPLAIV